jgi:hypothetical protein
VTPESRGGDAPSHLARAVLVGSLGFGLASLAVFATVAYAEIGMYRALGIGGAYAVWTALFVLLGSLALRPLVRDPARRKRFPLLFGLAFLAYALGWITAYFILRGVVGEWVGSLLGSVLLALAFAAGFRALPAAPALAAVLFVANSLGYFLGSALDQATGRPLGMLLWGLVYGLFLGAGLGFVVERSQDRADQETPSGTARRGPET